MWKTTLFESTRLFIWRKRSTSPKKQPGLRRKRTFAPGNNTWSLFIFRLSLACESFDVFYKLELRILGPWMFFLIILCSTIYYVCPQACEDSLPRILSCTWLHRGKWLVYVREGVPRVGRLHPYHVHEHWWNRSSQKVRTFKLDY